MKHPLILIFFIFLFSINTKSQSSYDPSLHKAYYKAITRWIERNVDVVNDYRLNSFALISIDIIENNVKKIETTAVDSVLLLLIDSSKLETMSTFYTDLSKSYGFRDCIFIQPISLRYKGDKTPNNNIPDARILVPFYYGLTIKLKPKIMLDIIEIDIYDPRH
ncbi:MAG: hypothetical protein ACRC2O_11735 [Chitinophagaceae bacterium]